MRYDEAVFKNPVESSTYKENSDFICRSVDARMYRIPNDLNDPEYRKQYIQNHIKWFLTNHENMIEQFLNDVNNKYKID